MRSESLDYYYYHFFWRFLDAKLTKRKRHWSMRKMIMRKI